MDGYACHSDYFSGLVTQRELTVSVVEHLGEQRRVVSFVQPRVQLAEV